MSEAAAKPSIREALFNRRALICVFTGFSSGLPLYLLLNLVPAWLRTEGLSLKAIGALTLVQFPYTWKFIWAPLLDRYGLRAMGRRRTWMAVSQLGLLGCIAALGVLLPRDDLGLIVPLTAIIAWLSATQDIALDAYRREILPDHELGIGNSVHVSAYRLSGLIPGSLALILSDHIPWDAVFFITSLFVIPGILLTIVVKEPEVTGSQPRNLIEAVVEPFKEFISRNGWRWALMVLAFMFFYKLGDSMCTALATPFYIDMGYSNTDIGSVAKVAGLWASIFGGIVGGIALVKLSISRALWLFGVVQLISILGFAALALPGKRAAIGMSDLLSLGGVISFEALGVGLGGAAFVAFIAKTTNPRYTATQLALFTSLAAVPRTFINAATGFIVEAIGWVPFFLLCTVLGLPGMILLFWVAPWRSPDPAKP